MKERPSVPATIEQLQTEITLREGKIEYHRGRMRILHQRIAVLNQYVEEDLLFVNGLRERIGGIVEGVEPRGPLRGQI
jgi:hypothetical protein